MAEFPSFGLEQKDTFFIHARILRNVYQENYDWFRENDSEIIISSLDMAWGERYYNLWFYNEEIYVKCILTFGEGLKHD